MEKFENIRQLIKEDQIQEALTSLEGMVRNTSFETEVVLLKNRFSNLRRSFRLRLESSEMLDITKNRIVMAALEILSELQTNGGSAISPLEANKKEWLKKVEHKIIEIDKNKSSSIKSLLKNDEMFSLQFMLPEGYPAFLRMAAEYQQLENNSQKKLIAQTQKMINEIAATFPGNSVCKVDLLQNSSREIGAKFIKTRHLQAILKEKVNQFAKYRSLFYWLMDLSVNQQNFEEQERIFQQNFEEAEIYEQMYDENGFNILGYDPCGYDLDGYNIQGASVLANELDWPVPNRLEDSNEWDGSFTATEEEAPFEEETVIEGPDFTDFAEADIDIDMDYGDWD